LNIGGYRHSSAPDEPVVLRLYRAPLEPRMRGQSAPEQSPWIAARQSFGRIAIANSDAVADAMTEGAFRAAHMAVEALVKN
jgi:hypothetical protein